MVNVTQSATNSLTFTKTGGSNLTWDASVYSQQGYVRGAYLSVRAGSTTGYAMVGLNSDPTASDSFASIDYALYFNN